jgi:hypothetical protein
MRYNRWDYLCINRWHNENDNKNNIGLEDKKDQTERNSTYKGCIIEYLLVCTKCEEQTDTVIHCLLYRMRGNIYLILNIT